MNWTPGSINDAILDLEDRLGLLDLEVHDIELWAALRFRLSGEAKAAATTMQGRMSPLSNRITRQLRTLPWRHPQQMLERMRLPADARADLLVLAHPRLVQHGSQWVCRYTYPLLEGVRKTQRTLMPTNHGQRYEDDAPSVYWAELDLVRAVPHARVQAVAAFARRGRRDLEDAVVALERHLGVTLDRRRVRRHALLMLALDAFWVPFFHRLLDRVQPRAVVEVVHYNDVSLILNRVCHARGVPVIELQHGLLTAGHLAYRSRASRRRCWPTALATWGQVWNDSTPDLFLPSTHCPPIGYAWLEHERASAPRRAPSEPTLLILSQWVLGDELCNYAVACARALGPKGWRVRFRLHPNERVGWRERYPALCGSGIEVIDGDRSLYEDQSEATAQLGVYSTALIEGLSWGLPTFVATLDGWQSMKWLLDAGVAHRVESADELVAALSDLPAHTPSTEVVERIWPSGAQAAFRQLLGRVLDGGLEAEGPPPAADRQP